MLEYGGNHEHNYHNKNIDRRKGGSIPDVQILTSLVHTVPVYAPARPGSLQPADRSETGRLWDGIRVH